MDTSPIPIGPAPKQRPPEGWVSYIRRLKAGAVQPEDYIRLLEINFPFFLWELWIDRRLQDADGRYGKAPLSDLEIDLGVYLESGPRRRVAMAYRGVGKTHIVAALILYRLFRDPGRQIILISKSEREARKTARLVRKWIGSVWFLRQLEPRRDQLDAVSQFEVNNPFATGGDRQPNMFVLGIGGQSEGNRAHTFVFDDIETKNNSRTIAARAALREMSHEFDNIVYPYRPHSKGGPVDPSEIIGVGTPKNEETLYLYLADSRQYGIRTYPIVIPPPEAKVRNLAPFLLEALASGKLNYNDPTTPKRFGPEEIRIRRSAGLREFYMEFLCVADLGDNDEHPLKLRDLIVFPVHRDVAPAAIVWGLTGADGSTAIPDSEIESRGLGEDRLHRPIMVDREHLLPYTATKAGLDPAGRGTDKTGLTIVSHLNGMFWLKACEGLPGGADDEAINRIVATLRYHNAIEVGLETNIDTFGTFENQLSIAIRRHELRSGDDELYPKGWSCRIVRVRAVGMKEERIISTLEPLVSSHRIVVDPSVLVRKKGENSWDDFQYQFTRIMPIKDLLKEDGKLDSFQIALQMWSQTGRIDPAKAQAEAKAKLIEEDVRRRRQIVAGLFGQPVSQSWHTGVASRANPRSRRA